jgi:K+-sensing histidine kinase KdpD
LRRVFEPFVRGSDQKGGSGFGLGLALVNKVITQMAGRVWAEAPKDGPGAVICFALPAG